MSRPLFSVIIPAYNRATFIAETIWSVSAQSCTDYEFIVADDGSTDGTVEVVRQVGKKVRLIRQENAGPGAARNRAAEASSGEYLAFLDSDDLWLPWTLATYARVITETRPSFIAGRPHIFHEAGELSALAQQPLQYNLFDDYLASTDQWRWFGASSFVIRREQFLEAGGFCSDRIHAEDADLALRLGTSKGFVQVTGPVTFGYRMHEQQTNHSSDATLQGVRRLIELERLHKYPGGSARSRERRRAITRHVRPYSLERLREGDHAAAWWLYRRTLPWNVSLGKLKYVAAFPVEAMRRRARKVLACS